MCGRYQLALSWPELVRLLGGRQPPGEGLPDLVPRHNVAPTQPVPVLAVQDAEPTWRAMRWGFPPTWVAREGRDPWRARALINARAEEAARRRTWAGPLRHARCAVPATGFYEFVRAGRRRLPLLFRPREGRLLLLAGLYRAFPREGGPTPCVAILTAAAPPEVAPWHDRAPVILPPEALDRWLDPAAPPPADLLAPAPTGLLEAVEVSTALNRASAEGPELLRADWSREDPGEPSASE